MIGSHDCASPPGQRLRTVIFLDGHVEVMNEKAWESRIVPFFAYR
jgi:prepilin-type processing-associated H-X9-DG protein